MIFRRFSILSVLMTLTVSTVVVLTVAVGLSEWFSYQLFRDEAVDEASVRSSYLMEGIGEALWETARELDRIAEAIGDGNQGKSPDFPDVEKLAEDWGIHAPELVELAVVGKSGRRTIWLREGAEPEAAFDREEADDASRTNENGGAVRFRIASRQEDSNGIGPIIHVTRVLPGRDGSSVGSLEATLDPRRLTVVELAGAKGERALSSLAMVSSPLSRSLTPDLGATGASNPDILSRETYRHGTVTARYDTDARRVTVAYRSALLPGPLTMEVEPSPNYQLWRPELRRVGALVLGFLGVLAALVMLSYRYLIRPMQALHGAVVGVSNGDLDRVIALPRTSRELHEVGRGVEAMRATLSALTDNLHDLVEMRSAELKRQYFYFDLALDHMANAIVIFDETLSLVGFNRRFLGKLGLSEEEVPTGMSLRDLVSLCLEKLRPNGGTNAAIVERMMRTESLNHPWAGSVRTPDGRVIEISSHPASGGHHLFTLHDVSTHTSTQERLRQAVESSEQASRAKSAFLANMSHELRTPLNAIIGFSEVIAGQILGPIGNERYASYARDIFYSGHHLLSFVTNILDLSKAEANALGVQHEAFDPVELVTNTVSMSRGLAEKGGIGLILALEEIEGDFVSDPTKWRQILINLLSNAIKFTPKGGSITVSLRRDEAVPQRGGRALVLEVRDTGVGMTERELEHAFEVFGQNDNAFSSRARGTGLGLPLTKRLVELLGGRLEVESAVGRGTAVTVILPEWRAG